MAIWKDHGNKQASASPAVETTPFETPVSTANLAPANLAPADAPTSRDRGANRELKESLIGPDITIEGKIEGAGHVRVAGKFKGDVNVQGDLTIEAGANLTGGVRARKVIIAGELHGNIEEAAHVDLQNSGVLNGDLKAGSLTVAAGSRMRGQVEFGWEQGTTSGAGKAKGNGHGTEVASAT